MALLGRPDLPPARFQGAVLGNLPNDSAASHFESSKPGFSQPDAAVMLVFQLLSVASDISLPSAVFTSIAATRPAEPAPTFTPCTAMVFEPALSHLVTSCLSVFSQALPLPIDWPLTYSVYLLSHVM